MKPKSILKAIWAGIIILSILIMCVVVFPKICTEIPDFALPIILLIFLGYVQTVRVVFELIDNGGFIRKNHDYNRSGSPEYYG
jgi:hypothetical protein